MTSTSALLGLSLVLLLLLSFVVGKHRVEGAEDEKVRQGPDDLSDLPINLVLGHSSLHRGFEAEFEELEGGQRDRGLLVWVGGLRCCRLGSHDS